MRTKLVLAVISAAAGFAAARLLDRLDRAVNRAAANMLGRQPDVDAGVWGAPAVRVPGVVAPIANAEQFDAALAASIERLMTTELDEAVTDWRRLLGLPGLGDAA